MIEIGRTQTLRVEGIDAHGYSLGDGESQILLPKKLAKRGTEIGQNLEVFVYTDSEDRPVATTQRPLAEVGDFACLKVIDENRTGAFLEWGLDKDLFVPRSQQHIPMVVGRSYVVAVFLDTQTNRVAAASRLGEFFDYDLKGIEVGSKVPLLVYGHSDRGTQVLVSDRYSGLLYRSETFVELKIGEKMEGFVAAVRVDNKLDIRLQRTGPEGQKDATLVVLDALLQAGGELLVGDKSPPEAIYHLLGLSKKAFKTAVGMLFKAGRVKPSADRLVLIKPATADKSSVNEKT